MKRPGGFDGGGRPSEHDPFEPGPLGRDSERSRVADAGSHPEPEPPAPIVFPRAVAEPPFGAAAARPFGADATQSIAGGIDADATQPLDDAVDRAVAAELGAAEVAGEIGAERDGRLESRDAAAAEVGGEIVGAGGADGELGPGGLLGLLSRRTGDSVLAAERRLKQAERSRRSRERRDRKRFTAHARRRRRNWLIAVAAVAALALFVVAGVFTPLMAVREVQVVGATQVNVADVQTAMSRFEGMPLALVDDREVHRALEPFALIQRYAIERIPPHTLLIRIEERDAVIALERDGALGLFDPAGVLVGSATERPEGVPAGGGAVADTASPAFQAAGTVIRDMPADVRSQLAAVEASSAQDVEFVLASGTRVIWGEAAETQRKAAVLRAMLASIGQASLIDLSAPDTPVFR